MSAAEAVLAALRTSGRPMTRADLARVCRTSLASICRAVDVLRASGQVAEAKARRGVAGALTLTAAEPAAISATGLRLVKFLAAETLAGRSPTYKDMARALLLKPNTGAVSSLIGTLAAAGLVNRNEHVPQLHRRVTLTTKGRDVAAGTVAAVSHQAAKPRHVGALRLPKAKPPEPAPVQHEPVADDAAPALPGLSKAVERFRGAWHPPIPRPAVAPEFAAPWQKRRWETLTSVARPLGRLEAP